MKTLLQTILSLLILTVSIDSYASCESVSHGDRVRDIDNLRVR